MVENEKLSSIVSSYSLLLLLEVWEKWDVRGLLLLEVWEKWVVRGLVLFSLTLQIILSLLGRCRKYKISYFFKAILWFAYLGADWIAIATLSKLSSSRAESTANNVLRAYWAPLLLVHLGGPDTIIAYAFEDNKLWIRHLIILIVKVILVIYVVCLSWTSSWLSFLTLPLILAGIIKYVEKILCLKLNNSQKTKPVISNMLDFRGHSNPFRGTLDCLYEENRNVLSSYLLFTIMRPDVNDYLPLQYLDGALVRMEAYLRETTGREDGLAYKFVNVTQSSDEDVFELTFIQLGFMFDVLYTKASLIFTKLGCFLRLTSFTSCFSVLLLFFIKIINEPKFHASRIDITITGILLSGAIAQELYSAWVMLSSDWAVLLVEFHHNVLVRKMFEVTLKCFPCLLHQSKRWSNQMGQFDLLEYCWRYKERKGNQSHGFLPKITIGTEIAKMWHKYRFTKFVGVPPFLLQDETYSHMFERISENSLNTTRGERALQKCQEFEEMKWSIELEFDHSIIIWHLATSVCYLQKDNRDDEAVKISKHVSDYMMYLLAMCPALLLSEHSKNFWLDLAYDNLKEFVSPATDIRNDASTLLSNPDNVQEQDLESRPRKMTFENLIKKEASEIVEFLNRSDNKWEMIKDVWIEMLCHAAVSSQHINHVKQLAEGIEFLSLIRLFAGMQIISLVNFLD